CNVDRQFDTEEAIMATKAYILIKVKAGKTKDVIKHLKKIPGVEQVHPCFGQPDIFSFVSVDDEKALSDLVITKVHIIDGVEETDTHIVAET
ncbi:MAG: Lrp/AsnC ligand binding domain-containing protein, partial [Nitrospirota bacterium]|nr:Lrp/AsnC ligand binding domain-containing protein [Nitrospirota bacterium]